MDLGGITSETVNVFCMGNEMSYTKSNDVEIGIQILLLCIEYAELNLRRIYSTEVQAYVFKYYIHLLVVLHERKEIDH